MSVEDVFGRLEPVGDDQTVGRLHVKQANPGRSRVRADVGVIGPSVAVRVVKGVELDARGAKRVLDAVAHLVVVGEDLAEIELALAALLVGIGDAIARLRIQRVDRRQTEHFGDQILGVVGESVAVRVIRRVFRRLDAVEVRK